MTNWDENSDQLRDNLGRVLSSVRADALARAEPTVETARKWHKEMMHRLTPPKPEYIG